LQGAEQIIIHALNQHASDQKSLRKIYGEKVKVNEYFIDQNLCSSSVFWLNNPAFSI
jgi:hypothetical protein